MTHGALKLVTLQSADSSQNLEDFSADINIIASASTAARFCGPARSPTNPIYPESTNCLWFISRLPENGEFTHYMAREIPPAETREKKNRKEMNCKLHWVGEKDEQCRDKQTA